MPLTRRNQDHQQRLLDRIVDAVKHYRPLKDRRQWRRFVNEYYRNLSVEDAERTDPIMPRCVICAVDVDCRSESITYASTIPTKGMAGSPLIRSSSWSIAICLFWSIR